MNLYIDIGNSRIKWLLGDSDSDTINSHPLGVVDLAAELSECWNNEPVPERIIVASVGTKNITDVVDTVCEGLWSKKTEYLTVQKEFCDVIIAYDDTDKLGVDRWLVLIAAFNQYRTNLCIVDCGTAVTVDVISATGKHQGGYIIPGADMMRHALVTDTERILVSEEAKSSVNLGQSTDECINNGIQLIVASFIDRVVTSLEDQYQDNLKCILTGGGAESVMKLITTKFIYEPNLVLYGVRQAGSIRKQ